jgi:glycerophosphoryl diester phosphodiesterase
MSFPGVGGLDRLDRHRAASVEAVQRHRVLVSAHRCGYAELGTVGGHEDPVAGIAHSAGVGADYCEFDVRRCADGTFVVSHDADGGTGDETLRIHDLPGDRACQIPGVVRLDVLVEHIDPARIVFTAGVRATTRALRAWADEHAPPLVVALSIGGSVRGMTWRNAVRRRWGELFPQLRFERSGADGVAAHFALAMIRLARWTTHLGVPLLVWTVDSDRLQKRFLHDRRIWMITTNRPGRAVALRDRRPDG